MKTNNGFEVVEVKQKTSPTGADQKVWNIHPPVKYTDWDDKQRKEVVKTTDHVMTSAVNAMFSGPETYIFPCDKDGKAIAWGELPGSYQGGYNHIAAIMDIANQEPYE